MCVLGGVGACGKERRGGGREKWLQPRGHVQHARHISQRATESPTLMFNSVIHKQAHARLVMRAPTSPSGRYLAFVRWWNMTVPLGCRCTKLCNA